MTLPQLTDELSAQKYVILHAFRLYLHKTEYTL
jgi:hypothetical protein